MVEKVLFRYEATYDRNAIAEYLEQVAANLRDDAPLTLRAGDESVTLDVPQSAEFEVKAEREGPDDGPGELSIEFELEWDEDGDDSPLEVT